MDGNVNIIYFMSEKGGKIIMSKFRANRFFGKNIIFYALKDSTQIPTGFLHRNSFYEKYCL